MTNEPTRMDDGTVVCHSCGEAFERIGYHWSNGSCDYPRIPHRKQAIITGLMLGDGTLRTHTQRPFVQTYMTSKRFLGWVDEQCEWLTTGVSLYRTAERSAELSRNNGNPDADEANYSDVYVLQTRTMPQFERFESWYTGGAGKRFPDYLVLVPVTTKIWYVCDGSLNWDRRYPGARPHITVRVQNEDTIQNVLRMFDESTFDHTPTADSQTIRFTVDETEALLDWMGRAPPGFAYKWCLDSLDRYERLKDGMV